MIDVIDRECRICGCTENRACRDPRTGHPCAWVAEDLCSACVPQALLQKQMRMAAGFALADALQEWQELHGAPVDETLQEFAAFFFSRGFDGALAFVEALEEVAGYGQASILQPRTRLVVQGEMQFTETT